MNATKCFESFSFALFSSALIPQTLLSLGLTAIVVIVLKFVSVLLSTENQFSKNLVFPKKLDLRYLSLRRNDELFC